MHQARVWTVGANDLKKFREGLLLGAGEAADYGNGWPVEDRKPGAAFPLTALAVLFCYNFSFIQ